MAGSANVPLSRRVAALITVIVLHAALLALFLATRSPFVAPAEKPGALTVVSLADEASATPPPPPQMPSEVLDEVVQLAKLALSTETDPNSIAASASGCAALQSVTDALLTDAAAVAAVLQAPPETRSIADAIVVWNAGWSEATATAGAPLEPVRASVRQSLASVDGGCLDEPIAGPRLVPIPAGAGTMFLVFGSGTWTWRQLTLDSDPTSRLAEPALVRPAQATPLSSMVPRWN